MTRLFVAQKLIVQVPNRYKNVGMPGLGSRWNIYLPRKWSNKWRCNQHTSVDQAPILCVPVASSGLKPKGRVLKEDPPAVSSCAAKPINATTPGLGTSVC